MQIASGLPVEFGRDYFIDPDVHGVAVGTKELRQAVEASLAAAPSWGGPVGPILPMYSPGTRAGIHARNPAHLEAQVDARLSEPLYAFDATWLDIARAAFDRVPAKPQALEYWSALDEVATALSRQLSLIADVVGDTLPAVPVGIPLAPAVESRLQRFMTRLEDAVSARKIGAAWVDPTQPKLPWPSTTVPVEGKERAHLLGSVHEMCERLVRTAEKLDAIHVEQAKNTARVHKALSAGYRADRTIRPRMSPPRNDSTSRSPSRS